jgi:hypothetical protein
MMRSNLREALEFHLDVQPLSHRTARIAEVAEAISA